MKSFMSSYGLHLFPGKKPHLRPNIDGATHPSTDDHDIPGHIDISTHGTHELSDRYPFNKDLNAGNVIGIGAPYRILVTVLTLLTCVTSVRLPLRTAHAIASRRNISVPPSSEAIISMSCLTLRRSESLLPNMWTACPHFARSTSLPAQTVSLIPGSPSTTVSDCFLVLARVYTTTVVNEVVISCGGQVLAKQNSPVRSNGGV